MKKTTKKHFMYTSTSSLFGKKLQPVTKAWKSFAATLHDLDLPKAITTLQSAAARCLRAAIRRLLPLKHRLIMLNANKRRAYSRKHFRHYDNYGPIYIDELYEENKVVVEASEAETSSGSVSMRGKRRFDVEEAWRAAVAMSPQLRPVDERADDFIYRVREELKIESQRSIVEFQDMLKRSV